MGVKTQDKIEIATAPSVPRNDVCYNWMDNLDMQKLLDVVSSIIADEYIEVAKRNKDIFGGNK